MPSGIKSSIKAGASGEGWLKPDNYATGSYYTNPYDRQGFEECFVALLAGTVGSSGTVDGKVQQSTISDLVNDLDLAADAGVTFRYNTADQVEIAVHFTTPNNGGVTVTKIQARFKAVGALAASKQITATIQADSSDSPSDTDLFTPVAGDVAPDGLSTSAYTTVTFTLATPYALAANTKYWIVFESNVALSTSIHMLLGVDTVASGGNVAEKDTTWGTSVTTQVGHVAVLGYDWTDITGAAFTQVTATNDDAPQYGTIDLTKAAGSHLRGVMTVGTAACDAGMLLSLSGPATKPAGQSYTFAV